MINVLISIVLSLISGIGVSFFLMSFDVEDSEFWGGVIGFSILAAYLASPARNLRLGFASIPIYARIWTSLGAVILAAFILPDKLIYVKLVWFICIWGFFMAVQIVAERMLRTLKAYTKRIK